MPVNSTEDDVPQPARKPLARSASVKDRLYPLRMRRLSVLRIMLGPRTPARLLDTLAHESDLHRYVIGMSLNLCAENHLQRSPFDFDFDFD